MLQKFGKPVRTRIFIRKFAKISPMKRIWWYLGFFVLLLAGFWFFLFKDHDFSQSSLAVINPNVARFSFIDQNGKTVTESNVDGKVYVAEFFFTTCGNICPKMNANMRRIFDKYKNESGFMILSHTVMPETDSVPKLKAYERRMINGELRKSPDGTYDIIADSAKINAKQPDNPNWRFLTGDKSELYRMARQQGYLIDNHKTDSLQNISNQFIHTQFFALVDKQRRVRGIYDGLKEAEIQKLMLDIDDLLKEKENHQHFLNGSN